MPIDQPRSENTYVIDPESAAEMARLMKQDRLFTENMGDVLPELNDLSNIHDILDIACGPGGWVLDVAHSHPKINVTGIDISRTMIEYARAQAWSQGLNNATFKIMNALKPLEFASASFDLVNARFLQGFTPAAVWPKLIQEFVRITRPGGIIRITESEDHGVTNSPGFQRLSGIAMQALKNARYSFSPDGRSTGLIPVVGRFLRDAGCQDVHLCAYVIDCSAGTEAHGVYNQNFMVAYKLAQPFFLKWGGITQEEVDQIYQQMLDEMGSSDFCGVWMYVTTWAHTPKI